MRLKTTFKEFVELHENDIHHLENSRFPVLHSHGIHKFIGTNHARIRASQRHPDVTTKDWEDLHHKVETHVNSLPKEQKINGEHLFYSKSKHIGYVADVNHKNRTVRVITVLDKDHHHANKDTYKNLVESFEID